MKTLTNNPLLSIITLLLLTANIVSLVFLWTHKHEEREGKGLPPPPGGNAFEFVSSELKLDSTQREAYKKLREEHQAGQKPLQDSIRTAKDRFFALLQQANVADSLIQAGSRKISETEQQLDILTFRHFQKLKAICNTEQQKKFDEIIGDVMRRMAPPKRRGPPPGREGEGPGRDHMPPPPDGNEPPR